ncbi:Ig-like domain-containing protein [Pseudomonas sp. GOM6]|uniref:tandem-95 repeat protein n=1 Tax=Pseudomonas sp. GOM6 TaxID=3036944 RepID=UPI002409B868|nr:Ig-like domain-containing protein [Pseudomonas sp. GOM6]MDG1581048.1 Ig-like domain-containing protein [Pseudomonas sp. GOM6]
MILSKTDGFSGVLLSFILSSGLIISSNAEAATCSYQQGTNRWSIVSCANGSSSETVFRDGALITMIGQLGSGVSRSGSNYIHNGDLITKGAYVSTTTSTNDLACGVGKVTTSMHYQLCVGSTNTPPVVGNLALSLNEDSSRTITLTASDSDPGDTHSFGVASGPSVGSASVSGNKLTYTPPANWNGVTSLTYAAIDSGGAWSNVATVSITVVPVNDIPSVSNRTMSLAEDNSSSITLTVTDVDLSYEGDSHTFSVVSAPVNGSAVISGKVLTFTPNVNWFGTTTLTYRAVDSKGAASSPATITITVTAVNDAPSVPDLVLDVKRNTSGSLSLSAEDVDPTDTHTFQIVSAGEHGTGSISGSTFSFTPTFNVSGTSVFTYRARDSGGLYSLAGTITVVVAEPVGPVLSVGSITAPENGSGSVTAVVTDEDPGDTYVIKVLSDEGYGTITVNGNVITFVPLPGWSGSTFIKVAAVDSAGMYSNYVTIPVTVTAVPKPPVTAPPTDTVSRTLGRPLFNTTENTPKYFRTKVVSQ